MRKTEEKLLQKCIKNGRNIQIFAWSFFGILKSSSGSEPYFALWRKYSRINKMFKRVLSHKYSYKATEIKMKLFNALSPLLSSAVNRLRSGAASESEPEYENEKVRSRSQSWETKGVVGAWTKRSNEVLRCCSGAVFPYFFPNSQSFMTARPIGTAGEYFCSYFSKFRQKINQNLYLICQKYQNFRVARMTTCKLPWACESICFANGKKW